MIAVINNVQQIPVELDYINHENQNLCVKLVNESVKTSRHQITAILKRTMFHFDFCVVRKATK